MDSTCIIIISSIFGGVCLFGSLACKCNNKNNRVVVPNGSIIISKEHYHHLQKIAADLPESTTADEPPIYTEP